MSFKRRLDNLSDIVNYLSSLVGNIIPSVDSVYYVGSYTKKFNGVYSNNITTNQINSAGAPAIYFPGGITTDYYLKTNSSGDTGASIMTRPRNNAWLHFNVAAYATAWSFYNPVNTNDCILEDGLNNVQTLYLKSNATNPLVGIGKVPSVALDVNGTGAISGALLANGATDNTVGGIVSKARSNTWIDLQNASNASTWRINLIQTGGTDLAFYSVNYGTTPIYIAENSTVGVGIGKVPTIGGIDVTGGVKTDTGITLPTTGGSASLLADYQEFQASTNLVNGCWASGQTCAYSATRLGNVVTFSITHTLTAVKTTPNSTLTFSVALPTHLRPTISEAQHFIHVIDTAYSSSTLVPCILLIATSGNITITLTGAGGPISSFSSTGTIEIFNEGFSFIYNI